MTEVMGKIGRVGLWPTAGPRLDAQGLSRGGPNQANRRTEPNRARARVRARAREVAPKDHPSNPGSVTDGFQALFRLAGTNGKVVPADQHLPAPGPEPEPEPGLFCESGRCTLTGILRKRQFLPHEKT